MASGINREIKCSQAGVRFLLLRVSGASGTRAFFEGGSDATIAAFSATGTYVVTLSEASRRHPFIQVTCATAGVIGNYSVDTTNAIITISLKLHDGTAADSSFHLLVGSWSIPDVA